MALLESKLIKKNLLTDDIYELHYELGGDKDMIAGQFITFILPGIGGRSYSLISLDSKVAILIIKRWSKEMGGRGGSIFLCDAELGDTFKYVGPTGHFILSQKNVSTCFLGTGTGLVPLYSQIKEFLTRGNKSKVQLVFGVKTQKDLFYLQNIQKLAEEYSNFSYNIYLSRENIETMQKGYVTDFLTANNIELFEEYYICGAPAMIESCQEKLRFFGIEKDKIFFEKY